MTALAINASPAAAKARCPKGKHHAKAACVLAVAIVVLRSA